MLGSVARVGRVLDLFSPDRPEWGASGVAIKLGIAKSSAHALLVTLDDIGLVRRLPDGRYRLGWRIAELNRALLATTDLVGPHRDRLQRIADELDAVVRIAGTRDGEIVPLETIVGHRVPYAVGTGQPVPAHRTALGRVILAWPDGAGTDAGPVRHPRRRARPDPDGALADELARIRVRGVATDVWSEPAAMCCVAAPIRGRHGEVDAALGLTAAVGGHPATVRRLEAVVRAAAKAMTRDRQAARLVGAG